MFTCYVMFVHKICDFSRWAIDFSTRPAYNVQNFQEV